MTGKTLYTVEQTLQRGLQGNNIEGALSVVAEASDTFFVWEQAEGLKGGQDRSFRVPFNNIKSLQRRMPRNGIQFLVLMLRSPMVGLGRTVGPIYLKQGGLPDLFQFLHNMSVLTMRTPDEYLLVPPKKVAPPPDPLRGLYEAIRPTATEVQPVVETARPYYNLAHKVEPLRFSADELALMHEDIARPGHRVAMDEIKHKLMDDDGVVAFSELRANLYHRGSVGEATIFGLELLLGIFPADATAHERETVQNRHRSRYAELMAQWATLDADQRAHHALLDEHLTRIEKDAVRADRERKFYADDDTQPELAVGSMKTRNKHIVSIYNILATFLMANFDLGYAQGMADFVAPILELTDGDEARVFWVFKALMSRYGPNFGVGAHNAIDRRLAEVRRLLGVVHPELAQTLDAAGAKEMYFCYRWLLLGFKREVRTYSAALRLWELCLSCQQTAHLDLVLALTVMNGPLHDHVCSVTDPKMITEDALLQWAASLPPLDVQDLSINAGQLLAAVHDELDENYLSA